MNERALKRGAAMKTKRAVASLLVLSLAFVAVGCGDEEQIGTPTTSEFLKERENLANRALAKPKPATPASTTAEEAAGASENTGYASGERDYFYDPRGKRDPFRSFRFVETDDESKATAFGPLGDFELGQLELSAVIWDAMHPRALILDPGGRAYIIHEGSQIGKNSGQVIHIGDNLVLVKETYENLEGEQTTKDVELRIRLRQGG
jgi:type IV pilus assembly protein PilP